MGVEATLNAARHAKLVIAQVNDQMPRTFGDCFMHVKDLDAVVEVSRPLCELKPVEITELHHDIGRHVATLIEDGSTLQLGIGAIPDAVLLELKEPPRPGHTHGNAERQAIPLIESGVINGSRKTIHPRKIVLGFVLGTKKLFDYVNGNPIFEFHPNSYTNDPFVISSNDKMAAINSALQVDMTGQVCADSMGTHFYSGIGGQVDFIRGASLSKGGKPIIAIPATAKRRHALAHRADAGSRSGRGYLPRFGVLPGDGIRRRLLARPDHPPACRSAHRNRPSRNSAKSCTRIARRRGGCNAPRLQES